MEKILKSIGYTLLISLLGEIGIIIAVVMCYGIKFFGLFEYVIPCLGIFLMLVLFMLSFLKEDDALLITVGFFAIIFIFYQMMEIFKEINKKFTSTDIEGFMLFLSIFLVWWGIIFYIRKRILTFKFSLFIKR